MELTARDFRIQDLEKFIFQMRSWGYSDAQIAKKLVGQAKDEVDAAFAGAQKVGIHPLFFIGGGTALLAFLGGALKKLAVPLGAAGVFWWWKKGKPRSL